MAQSQRRAPRQARAQVTREAILEAAAQILLTQGWQALTTSRIAQVAGVSVGSMYQYFEHKQAIVRELLERMSEEQHALLLQGLERVRAGAPLEEAVGQIIRATLMARLHSPALMRVCFEQLPAGEQIALMAQWSNRATPMVELALMARQDELRPGPHELGLAAFMLVHAIDGVVQASALVDPRVVEHASFERECTQLVLGYLRRA